jgi:hypothetical protein
VADYNSIHKDMCAKEFMVLKNCYIVSFPFVLCIGMREINTYTTGCGEEEIMMMEQERKLNS